MLPQAHAEPFDWSEFQAVIDQHVSAGERFGIKANLVDYAALTDSDAMAATARKLEGYNPEGLNREEKLAFYINAYNYFAIKIVVDHWPVDGIKDIGNFLRPVWKRSVGRINGDKVTLDQIEHDILRSLDEPRVHFAIVCASMSCPDLRKQIYRAERLDVQLDDQTKSFLNNPTKGARIEDGELYLSKIFDWFEEDFDRAGGPIDFAARYRPELGKFDRFKTLEYNWKLNENR